MVIAGIDIDVSRPPPGLVASAPAACGPGDPITGLSMGGPEPAAAPLSTCHYHCLGPGCSQADAFAQGWTHPLGHDGTTASTHGHSHQYHSNQFSLVDILSAVLVSSPCTPAHAPPPVVQHHLQSLDDLMQQMITQHKAITDNHDALHSLTSQVSQLTDSVSALQPLLVRVLQPLSSPAATVVACACLQPPSLRIAPSYCIRPWERP